jgi:hypothetical protein
MLVGVKGSSFNAHTWYTIPSGGSGKMSINVYTFVSWFQYTFAKDFGATFDH